jgi:type I restriction enzyme M protein
MLFLLHLASKLESPKNGGGRAAIVLSGSPLFNGGAGSGESEIRRWLLEKDMVEAIIALPTEIFFRTGIGTYLWILSNKKPATRKRKVQLINATGLWESIRNEGNKRRKVGDEHLRQIADLYAAAESDELSRLLDYRTFGYRRIRVLRPLRMRLHFTREHLARLREDKAWAKFTSEQQAGWQMALAAHLGEVQPLEWLDVFIDQATSGDPPWARWASLSARGWSRRWACATPPVRRYWTTTASRSRTPT